MENVFVIVVGQSQVAVVRGFQEAGKVLGEMLANESSFVIGDAQGAGDTRGTVDYRVVYTSVQGKA